MHENALVLQIGLEHAGPRKRHSHRHRFLAQLKDRDVLELITFLFADVNFSAGKLIDHLITAEQRHWVASSEIENGAAQFLLRRRRYVNGKPKTNHGADRRNHAERNRDARHAYAIGP